MRKNGDERFIFGRLPSALPQREMGNADEQQMGIQ